jgi:DNA polymerase-3 subunit delta'
MAGEAPPPRANSDLLGQDAAEATLRRLVVSGRLPHAVLLSGPRGVGKATLAFRLARFLLAPDDRDPEDAAGLAIRPQSPVFSRIAAGGHADLLTVERAWDPRRRRLRAEIIAEDAREIAGFFRLTAAEEGWRIVILDGAEEMNRSAANAVLKILEEPPRRGLLLLVSHSPGQLLPTIRSRCMRLPLPALEEGVVRQLLARYQPEIAAADAAALAALSGGSIGRALELAAAGGLDLYRALLGLLNQVPAIDPEAAHAFADRLARTEAEEAAGVAEELLGQFLGRLAADMARRRLGEAEIVPGEAAAMRRLGGHAEAARWAILRGEIDSGFARAEGLNLDRKQALLSAFFAIEALAR